MTTFILNLGMLALYTWAALFGGPYGLVIPWIARVWICTMVQIFSPKNARVSGIPIWVTMPLDGLAASIMAIACDYWTLGAFSVSCMCAYYEKDFNRKPRP